MSRVGKKPVELGKDQTAEVKDGSVTIKGKKGTLTLGLNSEVEVTVDGNQVKVAPRSGSNFANAMSGTTRAHIANMVTGVTKGFEKKLELVGVGYRAAVQGKKLNLTLGFSHPVEFPIPAGVTIETPSQNEIIVKGMDRQQVGQVAAVLRDYRPPEPYKGKGVRKVGEYVRRKEGKKK
jgi:large subunit ribosomal protein L6